MYKWWNVLFWRLKNGKPNKLYSSPRFKILLNDVMYKFYKVITNQSIILHKHYLLVYRLFQVWVFAIWFLHDRILKVKGNISFNPVCMYTATGEQWKILILSVDVQQLRLANVPGKGLGHYDKESRLVIVSFVSLKLLGS